MALRAIGDNRFRPECMRARATRVWVTSRGFTIVELLVTLAIVALLMGLLFPGLRAAREGAQRIQCSSNLRQIGTALYLFALHNEERLPDTIFDDGESRNPQEMMALTTGVEGVDTGGVSGNWDGLGHLIGDSKMFIDSPAVMYCPCHRGEHSQHVYEDAIRRDSPQRVFCNYHYVGDKDLGEGGESTQRRLFQYSSAVLVADGMRTESDINHKVGANALRGDGSVSYWADNAFILRNTFTQTATDAPPSPESFDAIWGAMSKLE